MQTLSVASSILRWSSSSSRIDPRELELSYAGPRYGLKEIARVGAAFAGILVYIGLVAAAGQ